MGTASKLHASWERHTKRFKPYNINPVTVLILFFTRIPELLETVESNLLRADDEVALNYRSTLMAHCSMTGVAAALVAQVASSSLQLGYMATIHWAVPALCTGSLVIGLLCVYYSFLLHYSLTKCAYAKDLRTKFAQRTRVCTSAGSGEAGLGSRERREDQAERGEGEDHRERGGREGGETGVGGKRSEEEEISERVEEVRERILASYEETLILWLPHYLLVLSILLYLATIFSYWAVAAGMDLEGKHQRSLVVFFWSAAPLSIVAYQWGLGMGGVRLLRRLLVPRPGKQGEA